MKGRGVVTEEAGAFKFGIPDPDQSHLDLPYSYPNLWQRQKTTGPERLVLAPAARQVRLFTDLVARIPEPLGLLYVLLVPRGEGAAGRYECKTLLGRRSLTEFLERFSAYFEGDGRHHLWVASPGTTWGEHGQIIYDNHNLIYAYGPLSDFIAVAKNRGLSEGDVKIPCPHVHKYNAAFDRQAASLLNVYEWRHFPLPPDDDP